MCLSVCACRAGWRSVCLCRVLSLILCRAWAGTQLKDIWVEKCRAAYATLLVAKVKSVAATAENEEEEKQKLKAHADDVITFRQLRGKGLVVTEIEDEVPVLRLRHRLPTSWLCVRDGVFIRSILGWRERFSTHTLTLTHAASQDALDLSRATGVGDGEDFASRLKRVTQLTGLSDPVYAEV